MKQIVLATNNPHKIAEISFMLKDFPVAVLSKKDFDNFPDVDEIGKTLEENAVLKAKAVYMATGLPSMADDSGLEVPVLGNRPGVNSARYAGPQCSFEDNNRKLLGKLEGVPEKDRDAVFRCVIAACFGQDDVEIVQGKVVGKITTEIRGKQGFGYDPVFYLPFFKKTFAEMSPEEKNRISHRAIALDKARELLIRRFELKAPAK